MDEKLRRLLDGGREIVDDEWLDAMLEKHNDHALTIRTAFNKQRLGIHDQYVAWIGQKNAPPDLEHREMRDGLFAFASK